MLKHRRYSRLPLASTLLGVTLATLVVWRYRRKPSGSQRPTTTATKSSDDGGRSASSAGISSESLPTSPAGIPSDDLPVIAVSTTGSDSPLRPPVANPERPPTYNLPVHLRHSGRSSARQLRRAGVTEQQNVPAYPAAASNANSPANTATTTDAKSANLA
ncbi:hypothetical protein H2248_010801 [Termitomyces sp. 'cryptogamus']|nr:hypothetical protein H2248_010801 [Termitomyces sp. 'cryptogamus']